MARNTRTPRAWAPVRRQAWPYFGGEDEWTTGGTSPTPPQHPDGVTNPDGIWHDDHKWGDSTNWQDTP